MRPVTVVHVITRLEFGGAQQNTLYTVKNLDRERFSPVLVAGPGGYLMPEAERMDLPVHIVKNLVREIRPASDIRACVELTGLLRSLSPGPVIVHTHSSKAGIVGRWAARRAKVPVIVHSIHGFGFAPSQGAFKRSLLRTAERTTSRVTDHFIAVSHANRDDGINYNLFEAGRCSVIRSGFDLDLFRNAEPLGEKFNREWGLPNDCPLVLMVACLKPQKAPLDFVRVAGLVHSRRPDARFLLAGDGELKVDLDREIGRLGLENVFHHLGWREDVPRLMKSSDLFVLTSRWEGLPRVIPQSKAAGRPVVATAVDGSREAVVDGIDGYLCQPGDMNGMADRVLSLIDDKDLAGRMGAAGSRTVDEFDRDDMVRMQEELYLSLLADKGITVTEEGR